MYILRLYTLILIHVPPTTNATYSHPPSTVNSHTLTHPHPPPHSQSLRLGVREAGTGEAENEQLTGTKGAPTLLTQQFFCGGGGGVLRGIVNLFANFFTAEFRETQLGKRHKAGPRRFTCPVGTKYIQY